MPRLLFEAPFAVLSHGPGDDPTFDYANQAALDLFQGDWPQVVGMPSQQSADPEARGATVAPFSFRLPFIALAAH